MNVLRKLAWAAMLVGSGVPSTQAPRPAPAEPEPHVQPTSSPDVEEDEFEGEGWSFWPFVGRGD